MPLSQQEGLNWLGPIKIQVHNWPDILEKASKQQNLPLDMGFGANRANIFQQTEFTFSMEV